MVFFLAMSNFRAFNNERQFTRAGRTNEALDLPSTYGANLRLGITFSQLITVGLAMDLAKDLMMLLVTAEKSALSGLSRPGGQALSDSWAAAVPSGILRRFRPRTRKATRASAR
ncbi:MAG: hypothetical protein AAGE43_13725 [Pseudomonadota bacterium]